MKNTNNPKNRLTAEHEDHKSHKKEVMHAAVQNERLRSENKEEQEPEYRANRGYYSRNGGDKGYRGL